MSWGSHIFSIGTSTDNLIIGRTFLFPGMSSEVYTLFNESDITNWIKCKQIPCVERLKIFCFFLFLVHKVIPEGGLKEGERIGVADSAYLRSKLKEEVPLWLPSQQPEDCSNLSVCLLLVCSNYLFNCNLERRFS
jgi:hypothetical protein